MNVTYNYNSILLMFLFWPTTSHFYFSHFYKETTTVLYLEMATEQRVHNSTICLCFLMSVVKHVARAMSDDAFLLSWSFTHFCRFTWNRSWKKKRKTFGSPFDFSSLKNINMTYFKGMLSWCSITYLNSRIFFVNKSLVLNFYPLSVYFVTFPIMGKYVQSMKKCRSKSAKIVGEGCI